MKIPALLAIICIVGCTSSRTANTNMVSPVTLKNVVADTLTRDTLLQFSATPARGFIYDYLVYLPKGTRLGNTSYLIVETNNGGANDTLAYHEKTARYAAARSSVGNYVARKLKIPLLVPIFPRPATEWQYYTHALDRDVILAKQFGPRLDLQLLAMIDDAKKRLANYRLPLKDKFFITGFSASGTFANRFSLLHPEHIKALAAGGINGITILPVAQLNGKTLNYPLGTADFSRITGSKVNLQAFTALPQMLYMGEEDDNDAVAYDDAYSTEERELVYTLMGKRLLPERWQLMEKIYQQYNVKVTFITYPGIGHGTDLRINNALVEFFRKNMD